MKNQIALPAHLHKSQMERMRAHTASPISEQETFIKPSTQMSGVRTSSSTPATAFSMRSEASG